MVTPLALRTEKQEPPVQMTKEKRIIFKEKHKKIYDAFLSKFKDPKTLTTLENHAQGEIKSFEDLLSDEKTEESYRDAYSKYLRELNEQLPLLQDPNEKRTFAFMSNHSKKIFDNINPEDIKTLSKENFCELLLSVYKRIREENLADEENLNNGKIKQVVDECVGDIRGAEAKESLIKLIGWPLGIKVDPKNISGSIKDGLLEKVPFLGKKKEEEKEKPLSDEQMVMQFLRKSLLPILLFAFTLLIFGGGPIMTPIAVIGLIITEVKAVKSLFSNDKEGTLYNPHTEPEQKLDWNNKILNDINDILKIPVKEVEKGSEQLKVAPEVAQSQEFVKLWTETINRQEQNGVASSPIR
jgi:hypothetical protein